MDDKKRDRLIKRIHALYNLANGTPYEAEAEAARRQADSIMARYALSLDEVAEGGFKDDKSKPFSERIFIPDPYGKQFGSLLSSIYNVFGCQVVRLVGEVTSVEDDGTVRRGQWYYTAGYKEPMSMAWLAYQLIEPQLISEMYRQNMSRSRRISFIYSFISVIYSRLNERYNAEKNEFIRTNSEEVGTALVVRLDDQRRNIKNLISEEIGDTTSVRRSAIAWNEDGASAGRRANIGLGDRINSGDDRMAIVG